MRKLTALTAHLLAVSGLPPEQASAFADEGTLAPTGRHLGFVHDAAGTQREQLEVGIWSYEGVIQLERYPFDGPTLLAQVIAWLAEHDHDRSHQDVKDPKLTIHLNDAHTCDVELALEFEEALTVVEWVPEPETPPSAHSAPAGQAGQAGQAERIPYLGTWWTLAEPDFTPAERVATMQGSLRD